MAQEDDRGVFLVLTAPWNRDHFVLPDRIFRDEQILSRLRDGRWIPVLADASVHPELRQVYSIRSGLLPSFHFLDGTGRPIASFPPLGAEELAYYLDSTSLPGDGDGTPRSEEPPTLEMRADVLSNRCGRLLLELYERGERRLPVVHGDIEFGDLAFFAEMAGVRLRRRSFGRLEADCLLLLESELYDRHFGGMHRSVALLDGRAVHREMILRQNAEAGAVMAAWFRRTGREEAGRTAAGFVKVLNDFFRRGSHAIYVGSLSADIYGVDGALVLTGEEYYRRNPAGRTQVGAPTRSVDSPAGPNYVVQQMLLQMFRTWGDDRMRDAIRNRGPALREEGFEEDGAVRAVLGTAGVGNLRDQGDAGCGLLAEHSVTGSPETLRAAERLAEALADRFLDDDESRFRSVAKDVSWPEYATSGPVDPAWNGIALRFLAELAAMTGEERWATFARNALARWAETMPADGSGVGELGRAALRSERGMAVALIDAPAGSEEGDTLAKMTLRITTPLCVVRWLDPGDRVEVARRFGATLEDEPAVYICWDEASPACRRARDVKRAWLKAVNAAW